VDSAQQTQAATRPAAIAVLSSARALPWFSGSDRCRQTMTGFLGKSAWLMRCSGCSLSERMTSARVACRAVVASSDALKVVQSIPPSGLRPSEMTGTPAALSRR